MIPVFDYSLIDARVRLQDVPRLQKLVKKDSGAAKRDEQAGQKKNKDAQQSQHSDKIREIMGYFRNNIIEQGSKAKRNQGQEELDGFMKA